MGFELTTFGFIVILLPTELVRHCWRTTFSKWPTNIHALPIYWPKVEAWSIEIECILFSTCTALSYMLENIYIGQIEKRRRSYVFVIHVTCRMLPNTLPDLVFAKRLHIQLYIKYFCIKVSLKWEPTTIPRE